MMAAGVIVAVINAREHARTEHGIDSVVVGKRTRLVEITTKNMLPGWWPTAGHALADVCPQTAAMLDPHLGVR